MTYNLLDEQWIPVLYRNGDCERVGIRQALSGAGRIRRVVAMAMHRLHHTTRGSRV